MTIKTLQAGDRLHLLAYEKLLAYRPQGSPFFIRCPVTLTPNLERELDNLIKLIETPKMLPALRLSNFWRVK